MKKKTTKDKNKRSQKKTTDIKKVQEILSFMLDENNDEKDLDEDINEWEYLIQLKVIQEDTFKSDKENKIINIKESKIKKNKEFNNSTNQILEIKNEKLKVKRINLIKFFLLENNNKNENNSTNQILEIKNEKTESKENNFDKILSEENNNNNNNKN